jgi:hypothetical protein
MMSLYSQSCKNQIYFKGDFCYACPTNKKWNSIQAAIFQKHIEATHPTISRDEMPPDHTLIIKANIRSSLAKNSNQKIDKYRSNIVRALSRKGLKEH